MDDKLNRAIRERLLGDRVAFFTSFDLGFLYAVHLEQSIQFGLLAPSAVVIVEGHLSRGQIEDYGVSPARQLDAEAGSG